jgi:hypothetical protein
VDQWGFMIIPFDEFIFIEGSNFRMYKDSLKRLFRFINTMRHCRMSHCINKSKSNLKYFLFSGIKSVIELRSSS